VIVPEGLAEGVRPGATDAALLPRSVAHLLVLLKIVSHIPGNCQNFQLLARGLIATAKVITLRPMRRSREKNLLEFNALQTHSALPSMHR